MKKESSNNFFAMVAKGVIVSLVATLVAMLIFALIVKLTGFSATTIKIVNQFLKILVIFLGCFFSLQGSKGFLKGGIIGVASTIVTYLIFSLLCGELSFDSAFFIDLLFGLVFGVIFGIVTVNVKKD